MEQPGLQLAPIWDVGFTGGGFTQNCTSWGKNISLLKFIILILTFFLFFNIQTGKSFIHATFPNNSEYQEEISKTQSIVDSKGKMKTVKME